MKIQSQLLFYSRISEIIRQYNENNLQKSSSFQHDYESNDESVIAPPPPPLASGLEEGGGASVDSNEVSSLDEDWLLQKSLEKKRGCKRTSGLKKVSLYRQTVFENYPKCLICYILDRFHNSSPCFL